MNSQEIMQRLGRLGSTRTENIVDVGEVRIRELTIGQALEVQQAQKEGGDVAAAFATVRHSLIGDDDQPVFGADDFDKFRALPMHVAWRLMDACNLHATDDAEGN